MFHWRTHTKPVIALAPMAGVTDASYRQFIKTIAPEAIVFTEFLSSDAMHFGSEKTLSMLNFDKSIEKPFIVQIFGNNKEHFISSCKLIESIGADGIDINMGCPAAKVVSSCHGSALIRMPDLAAELIHSAVNAVRIPVSVKTRLGWDSHESLIPFCKKLVAAGASALSIHGRTYKAKFSGSADWGPIYELKKNVDVPVIGNGDIATAMDAVTKLGNLDGVMVGRGTMGNPWLLREIADAFNDINRRNSSDHTPLKFDDKIPFILRHCEFSIRHKGETKGILEMRKHFSGYVKGFDGAKEMRMSLMGATSMRQIEQIFAQARVPTVS